MHGDDGLQAEALAERMKRNMTGALELYTIYLGDQLGLYRALADGKPVTSAELADRTGTTERYIREWLEQQAAAGLLSVDDPAAGPLDRRFALPAGHLPVLADRDDVRYQVFNSIAIARQARSLPDLVEAYRAGGAPPAQPWAPEGRPEFNRATFLHLLGTSWLPAIGVVPALRHRRRVHQGGGSPGPDGGLPLLPAQLIRLSRTWRHRPTTVV